MHVFDLVKEQQWNPKQQVEKILGTVADGDVTVEIPKYSINHAKEKH